MPKAIIKGKLTRVPYGHRLPKSKKKNTKMSNSALSPPSEKDWMYQPVLLKGEKIISSRRTKVVKDPKNIIREIDEKPYGKISVTNDDLKFRVNPVRKAHHDGRLFLTNKRLVHVIKQGWAPWAKYTVDFDRPLSTIHTAATEAGSFGRKITYGKRLAVQHYEGDVDMFGDTILAKRDGVPIEERKETSGENKPREREEFKLVAEREKTFEEGKRKKRRFHVRGGVDEFAREIKDAAGIE